MKQTIQIDRALAIKRGNSSTAYRAMDKMVASIAKNGAAVPDYLADRYVAVYQALVAVDDQIMAAYVAPLEVDGRTATWTINAAAGTIEVTLEPKSNTIQTGEDLKKRYQKELDYFRAERERSVNHFKTIYAMRAGGASLDEELAWQLQQIEAHYQDDLARVDRWLIDLIRAGHGTDEDYTALTGKPFPAETEAANG